MPYPLAVTSSPGKMEVIRVNYALLICSTQYGNQKPLHNVTP